MTTVRVTAQADFIDRLISTPRVGLLELIWNALDADASRVVADLEFGVIGGVMSVVVADDGVGLSADRAEQEFGSLGGSWKKQSLVTGGGRALHGQQGRGRFAAYGLGSQLRWETVADATAGRRRTVIRGMRSTPDEYQIESQSEPTDTATGTTFTASELTAAAERYLDSDRVLSDLTAALAIYISKYHPTVIWRKQEIDPKSLIEDQTETTVVAEHEGTRIEVPVTIIEWKGRIERALYLCDADGVALEQLPPGIQAPGFTFTAYAKWPGFAERPHDLVLGESAPEPVPTVITAVQDELRRHFKARTDEKYVRLVEKWKQEKSYPFQPAAPDEDGAAKATRDLFDVVAFAAAPAVEKIDPAARRFSLRLLKEAVQYAPDTLHVLLQEIVALPEDQAEDLRELISKSSLTNLIAASRRISDRLEFLASLESIVNDEPMKSTVKERSQLHKILAEELWVFREEYALVGNDQTLRTVLRNHRDVLGDIRMDDDTDEVPDVLDHEGRVRVVDLMLSRVLEQHREHREHLVIELKRPSVHIGVKEQRQIEDYASMVAEDNRFASTDTRWEFWIVGDSLAPAAHKRAHQAGWPAGVSMQFDSPKITVRSVTWAQVIRDAKHRLKFVRDSLDYDPSTQQGLAYLRQEHAKFLPEEQVGEDAPSARVRESRSAEASDGSLHTR